MFAAFRPSVVSLTRGKGWDDDVDTRRMGALVYVLGALLTGVLVALVPPTAEGRWGWIVAAVIVALRVGAAGGLLTGRGPVRLGVVYAISSLNIAGLCVLQFLATHVAYFHDLVLIDLLYVAAVHTSGRTAAAVALGVLGLVPALVHGGESAVSVAEWVAEAILWALVAGLVVVYTGRMRAQRAALKRTGDSARALARIDALTGLGNRRAFDEALERELSTARRYATRLSVLIGDLDGFKAVNDRHGHPAGDELLRRVAVVLAEAVRRPDACFRWGGDEFTVLLPRTGLDEAEVVAARVRATIARRIRDPSGAAITISLGVAELGTDDGPADVVATADAALLAAKLRTRGADRRASRFDREARRRRPHR